MKKKNSKDLTPLFDPKSVAVIGASQRQGTVGHAILKNLISAKFNGKIYPVNPKAETLEGLKCYPSVAKIAESVDMAVIIVTSAAVPEVIKECAAKGVKAVIVISAGFKEVGAEGKKLEQEIIRIADEAGIPILGPNCLGLINTSVGVSMNASFAPSTPKAGNIAFISQSGALGTAVLDYAKGKGIGFSKFISLGNKANVNELDILRYLENDDETDVILLYVEDLVDGRGFIDTARDITGNIAHTKPILAIKSGRTPQGAKAASSHTGSLMGSDEVYDAIFAQSGVLRVDSVGEIFDYAIAFSNKRLPKGDRIAIITNAGGPGIMATDSCVRYGLKMAEIAPETVTELKKYLPATANFSNPIDVIGDAQVDRYLAALKYVIADPGVDGIIVILTPQAMTDIQGTAKAIVEAAKTTDKPILSCFMGLADVTAGVKILEENRIPHYPFPGEAAHTMAVMAQYHNWISRPRTQFKSYKTDKAKVTAILESAKKAGLKMLPINESMEVFKAYGLPLLPFGFAKSEAETVKLAKEVGFPVVLKVISQDVIHKFDFGGVKLNLKSEAEVKDAYGDMMKSILSKLPNAKIDGVFVQQMAPKGREVILGMNRDPHFGPILMFGLGGIYVEALKDVTFRVAPIRQTGARHMIEGIRAYPILKGVRGEAPADMDMMIECLTRLSQLSMEQPLIDEVDLNPLLVYNQGEGAKVIDARIILT